MTGGQFSATTPITVKSRCTPTLSEKPFDLMKLVMAAGASYAARVTVSHTERLILYLVNALSNPGFSFVEALASCPTHFGRHNNLDAPMDNIRWLETNFEPGEWRNP
ncbi:MAG: hypothetical protein A2293_10755 [Elusimicrobia bacterium RIFOXYB2_FULL_49_7]|nr:MAG: hypothetical protein A2293_10755 [Elusimicrobia bacterium RIFOXYB2_FULL_49_7]